MDIILSEALQELETEQASVSALTTSVVHKFKKDT
jgi:hypothetical protein